ncbi:MAG: ATP-binding protein, partial [Sandaracinaceae bacterium]|nr:ATP-binding protein [Sandaracinaceae bacterium]
MATPPRLVPRLRVPRELETWIHVLLAKRPRDRFACAADALGALRSLGEPYLEAQASAPSSLGALPTATSGTSEITHAATSGMAAVAPRAVPSPEESLREATERMRGHAEPASAETPLDSPLSITGIGLGVHGLRTIPLIGREREQAFLLSRLDRVRDERRPRAVVLRGREGQGKTRLAQWLVEHAIETGHAYPLWSAFGTQTSDAVARAIARALGVEGLSLSELATRLGDHPTEPALDALPESALGHATQPSERFRAIVSLLSVLGARRPVLLILDDAHLAREALGLAEHLLRLRSGAPSILLVLTVREETLDERSSEAAMLEALERGPRVERVTLGP